MNTKINVVFYTQHMIGLGHVIRMYNIALSLTDHNVFFITGGEHVDLNTPEHIKHIQLPAVLFDDDFEIISYNEENIEKIFQNRIDILEKSIEGILFDVIITEKYPFSLRTFKKEIELILNNKKEHSRIYCSIRDVLSLKRKYDIHEESSKILNILKHYDGILFHSDTNYITPRDSILEPVLNNITILSTGYIFNKPKINKINKKTSMITFSMGSGYRGVNLIPIVIESSNLLLKDVDHELHIFLGKYVREKIKSDYKHIIIHDYSKDFTDYLYNSDLYLGTSGYNTTLEIFDAQIPSIIYPWINEDQEQFIRIQKIDKINQFTINDFKNPYCLCELMKTKIGKKYITLPINLNGIKNTKKIIETGQL